MVGVIINIIILMGMNKMLLPHLLCLENSDHIISLKVNTTITEDPVGVSVFHSLDQSIALVLTSSLLQVSFSLQPLGSSNSQLGPAFFQPVERVFQLEPH